MHLNFFCSQYFSYKFTVKDSVLDLNLDLLVIKKFVCSLYPSAYIGSLYSHFIIIIFLSTVYLPHSTESMKWFQFVINVIITLPENQ